MSIKKVVKLTSDEVDALFDDMDCTEFCENLLDLDLNMPLGKAILIALEPETSFFSNAVMKLKSIGAQNCKCSH